MALHSIRPGVHGAAGGCALADVRRDRFPEGARLASQPLLPLPPRPQVKAVKDSLSLATATSPTDDFTTPWPKPAVTVTSASITSWTGYADFTITPQTATPPAGGCSGGCGWTQFTLTLCTTSPSVSCWDKVCTPVPSPVIFGGTYPTATCRVEYANGLAPSTAYTATVSGALLAASWLPALILRQPTSLLAVLSALSMAACAMQLLQAVERCSLVPLWADRAADNSPPCLHPAGQGAAP